MKAYLLHKDGRRVETDFNGAQRIHSTARGVDGSWLETVFHADQLNDDVLLYREGETKNVTADMQRAAEEIEERRVRVIRRGLGFDDSDVVEKLVKMPRAKFLRTITRALKERLA